MLFWLLAIPTLFAQSPTGQLHYNRLCAACHGGDGNGGERAPGIVEKLLSRPDNQLAALIRNGLPGAGMPPAILDGQPMAELLAFLRTLRPRRSVTPQTVQLATASGPLEGLLLNQGPDDIQILDANRQLRILRRAGRLVREVTSQSDWPTYHGRPDGNRYSAIAQIDAANIHRLGPRWIFSIPGAARLQVTPVVTGGVMYVTAPNECFALDPGTGRQIWHYRRRRTPGVIGDAGAGINRGVAVAGNRLFMVTDNAHLLALNRFKGALEWDTEMADFRQNYGATAAPLTVGNLVISGISGGDEGVRGFLAAYDQTTGKEAWRFWTVPARGEPLAETWKGKALEHGCAATWLTGTYDAGLDLLYWPTGNPCPDYNGDERQGDNLYSDTILALESKTGKLRWHYQYTPHDLWDWDAQQPPVLVDARWQGAGRKLLLHANRNGFFYILDRVTGQLLSARPFVENLTWAREIGADGRPVRNPGQSPSPQGTKVCPAVEGATNWFSTSYHPVTGFYYVQTLEKCNIFTKAPGQWEAGKSYYDGATRLVPGQPGRKILRAIDIQTGRIAWQLPQLGPANSWGGVLTTAGGIVLFGDDSGAFRAADAATGKPLWTFPVNTLWKASPMTYVFDNRQYVAIAAGASIIAFGLTGEPE
ncbi:MAG: PQQ-binding-like beta-propeller repeat protein [Bryobacteraceae bacterium]|nr:PQQ-binding-like beta-propeller repeat protein [Bryobacteraceae bacterium]